VDETRALGFGTTIAPRDNPRTRADGLVEVPKWRYALINIAHPLFKQGLVILTPGLNAIGAEPELTVSLIPQAYAVVFIMAVADTGVTKSDLAIWREHLTHREHGGRHPAGRPETRLTR
jgi:hypothetical protein